MLRASPERAKVVRLRSYALRRSRWQRPMLLLHHNRENLMTSGSQVGSRRLLAGLKVVGNRQADRAIITSASRVRSFLPLVLRIPCIESRLPQYGSTRLLYKEQYLRHDFHVTPAVTAVVERFIRLSPALSNVCVVSHR